MRKYAKLTTLRIVEITAASRLIQSTCSVATLRPRVAGFGYRKRNFRGMIAGGGVARHMSAQGRPCRSFSCMQVILSCQKGGWPMVGGLSWGFAMIAVCKCLCSLNTRIIVSPRVPGSPRLSCARGITKLCKGSLPAIQSFDLLFDGAVALDLLEYQVCWNGPTKSRQYHYGRQSDHVATAHGQDRANRLVHLLDHLRDYSNSGRSITNNSSTDSKSASGCGRLSDLLCLGMS